MNLKTRLGLHVGGVQFSRVDGECDVLFPGSIGTYALNLRSHPPLLLLRSRLPDGCRPTIATPVATSLSLVSD